MMALLSRLVDTLPASVPAGETCALLDDGGAVFLQRGTGEVTAASMPALALPVGPALPHWQVAVYAPAVAAGQGSVALFGTLLVAIFIVAILSGGGLLLWEGRRAVREAQRKTSFVANVSHELKTPLTTIRMYVDLLGEAEEAPERRRRYLEVIGGECQRLTRLVNNVLDFSRLEQGRKQYHLEPLALQPFLSGLFATQTDRLAAAAVAGQLLLPAAPVTVRSDRDALEQVLLNLIDNALKYAASGKELTLEMLPPQGATIRLRLLDRGPGIPAAHRGKIFDQFHRVDDSLTTRQPGCGLGLAISRQLLRDLGGELSWQPRPEGGSCFEIVLPLAEVQP
jgi:signal transduction histidine kinase